MSDKPIILFIDLFCGAGGVTTGAVRARMGKYQPVKVIACVNHDPLAIESHEYNHPGALHFSEDIRSKKVVKQLARYVEMFREKYPNALVALWASMECTNYSKAKGGMPRDPDSRTLPKAMYMQYDHERKKYNEGDSYLQLIKPDYFQWENVEEFMSWGPMRIRCSKKLEDRSVLSWSKKNNDYNWEPVSRKNGKDWLSWQKEIKAMGYRHEWRMLNSADFGAHTKRKRLFGIFAKEGLPIVWPEPTHAEHKDDGNMFGNLEPWKPVRECLDFEDEGQSIFKRDKPYVENTHKRFLAGLKKYYLNGDGFLCKYYGNGDNVDSLDEPCAVIPTTDRFNFVQTAFLDKGFSGVHNHQSIEEPAGSLMVKDHYSVVKAVWLDKQYKGKLNHESVNDAAGSILANPKHQLMQAFITDTSFNNVGSSIEDPFPTILANRKWHYLSSVHKVKGGWILNPQYSSKGGSIDEPCFTLIARMDKAPPQLVQYEIGVPHLKITDEDDPTMKEIKQFCMEHGIVDIKSRMLRVHELKKIQGFPDDYYLAGNQTDQKKFIGNSVVPQVVKAWMEALAYKLQEQINERMAA